MYPEPSDLLSEHVAAQTISMLKVLRKGAESHRVGRKVDIEQLVSANQIAQRLGVSHVQTIHTRRRRHADFPEPVLSFDRVLIWYWPDVRRWAHRTGRLTRRQAVSGSAGRSPFASIVRIRWWRSLIAQPLSLVSSLFRPAGPAVSIHPASIRGTGSKVPMSDRNTGRSRAGFALNQPGS